MVIVVEIILMGIVATYVMDLLSRFLARMKIIHPAVRREGIGRWILYMLRGKFVHEDINDTPRLNHEIPAAVLSHYLIGIGLAGCYVLLEANVADVREHWWMALLFGLATTLLPWFWLFPSTGLGFIASKSSRQSQVIATSLINHFNFGLGLLIWIVIFRPLLP